MVECVYSLLVKEDKSQRNIIECSFSYEVENMQIFRHYSDEGIISLYEVVFIASTQLAHAIHIFWGKFLTVANIYTTRIPSLNHKLS